MEKFIDVPTYEGIYQVSNYGNVKSLERYSQQNDGRNRLLKEKIIKPTIRKDYYRVTLRKDNVRKHYDIHMVVVMAFMNHIPNGYKTVVDHIDGNPKNNNLGNLQLISHRENCSKDKNNGTSKYVGVFFSKCHKRWVSRIQIHGASKHLGNFKSEYKAHLAYQEALKSI